MIFIVIKVLPLIALAVFAARQINLLGSTFKDKSDEMVENTRNLVGETGALATESSIAALDLKSRESIERLTTDIASMVAEFLYTRDKDILQAAELPVSESAYRTFLSIRRKKVVVHQDWVLNQDRSGWQPAVPNEERFPDVQAGSPDNRRDFHYRPPQQFGNSRMQPIYHEMTFVDLKGQERLKISATHLLAPGLRNISRKENTWCKAETYFEDLDKLKPGEIYVSRVIGPYLPSPIIGSYTPAKAKKAGIPFAPEKAGYAGKENPVGQRFQGIIRWASPVFKGGGKIGYVTLALDHTHLMEFTDHVVPTAQRYSDISDAGSGNYAFMWDYEGRNISHPRDYFIVGFDPQTGEQAVPWLSSELYGLWQSMKGSFSAFEKVAPRFQDQLLQNKPEVSLTKEGMLGLDCRYLNFAPQCTGWYNLTQHGGSGSFLIFWSNLWKLTTAAAIPYHTGIYKNSPRGFGFVTIGANVDEFHSAANATADRIKDITRQYETDLDVERRDALLSIEQRLEGTIKNLSVSTGVMIVVIIFIAIWMASTLTGKITSIIQGIRQFQSGRLSSRLKVESRDELGQLATALNDMSDQLQKSIAEIEKARKHAEQSDKAKSLFLANMSHEIRTPMNAIIGMAHLAMHAPAEDKQRGLMQTVQHSAEGLLGLLDDILDFSKMEAGQFQLNNAPFNLRRLLEDVVATMRMSATEKGLQLHLVLPDDLPATYIGDDLRVRQILLNLIGNAVKYTHSGSVTVKAVLENATDKAASVHFIVSDTGIGISPEKHSSIFNRFEQADNSYARQYGGAGLGLSICRELVALMAGKIWVESQVDVGSSFHCIVTLQPSTEQLPVHVAGMALSSDDESKGLRILIVDDNEVNRDVASMMLEQDHQVATAKNGLEALAALADMDFDVILMDVQMPEMDGLTATVIIRALEKGEPVPEGLPDTLKTSLAGKLKGGHVPIIAMTAHAMGEDRERCLHAGMDEYISKPFQYHRLVAVLQSLVAASLQHDRPEATLSFEATTSEPMVAHVTRYLENSTNLPEKLIAHLVSAARKSLVDLLDKAEKAVREKNYEDLAISTHTLKGTLLQCGLNDWAEKAQQIYHHARDVREFPFAERLKSIKDGVREFVEEQ